jgi:predicted chitinase
MSIVGAPFLPYVKDQIKVRQQVLGKTSLNSQDLTWINSKTSWIKLASSVNIESQVVKAPDEQGQVIDVYNSGSEVRQSLLEITNYGGNRLAQEMVLQAGVLNSSNGNLKFGVSENNTTLPSNPSNYGFGGSEFGLVPMPGITGFEVKTYNNGTLREATVNITVFNRKQFEYIDTLYLRLGYTMFIEWGNTSYPTSISNTGDASYSTGADISSLSLTNEFVSVANATGVNKIPDFETKIEENRKTSQGNYDGFIGLVKNFTWDFNPDRTYTITLILISAGSVIESLKINNQVEGISYTPPSGSSTSTSNRASALATFIELASTPVTGSDNTSFALKKFLNADEQKQLNLTNNYLTSYVSNDKIYYPILSCNVAYGVEDSTYCRYIQFGSLLGFISQKLLSYDSEGTANYVRIDYDQDTFVYSNTWSFSSDPQKLIVRFSKNIDGKQLDFFSTKGTEISPFHSVEKGVNVGRLMNVYFEYKYLLNVLKTNEDPEDGGVYLDKFLTTLLNDINVCLGGVNKIKYRVNKTEINGRVREVIQFYDEVTIFGKEKLVSDNYDYEVNLFGFNPRSNGLNEGSFVNDYGIRTEISKRLQTQIAIGAQAGGQAVGFDSTAISKWNVGLVDRVNPTKTDVNRVKKDAAKNYNDFILLAKQYTDYLKQLEGTDTGEFDTTTTAEDTQLALQQVGEAWDALGQVSGSDVIGGFSAIGNLLSSAGNVINAGIDQLLGTDITDYGQDRKYDSAGVTFTRAKSYRIPNLNLTSTEGENQWAQFQTIQSTFFSKVMAADALGKGIVTPVIGFLPINFTVTMDGLSGIRIFDKLQINSRFLPPNYGETLEFIITALDHKFVNNRWITSVQTTSIPKLYSKEAQVNLNVSIKEILEETTQQRAAATDAQLPDNAFNRTIITKIINRAKQQGITDYQRVFAILAVAYAESNFKIIDESFNYSFERFKAVFPGWIKAKGTTDAEIKQLLRRGEGAIANYLYDNRFGNGTNEGYTYRGRGLTQITFKGNYKYLDELLNTAKLPVSSFFPNNPNATLVESPNLLVNGSSTAQDLNVALLVVGKKYGAFGDKLDPNKDYINGSILQILRTQNGSRGKGNNSSPQSVQTSYNTKRNILKNSQWIFDLFAQAKLTNNSGL